MKREYFSQFEQRTNIIGVQKPHLCLYGGWWHCLMYETLQYSCPTKGAAWLNWFNENTGRSVAMMRYMIERPHYVGRVTADIVRCA